MQRETLDSGMGRPSTDYSYIDDEDVGRMPAMGRPSVLGNEDEYDYAIELLPDEEYRKSAKILGNISDFEDAEDYIEDLLLNEDDFDDHLGLDAEVPSSRRTTDTGLGSELEQKMADEDRDPSQLLPSKGDGDNISKTTPFYKKVFTWAFQKGQVAAPASPTHRGGQHQSPLGKDGNGPKLSPFSDLSELERGKVAEAADEASPSSQDRGGAGSQADEDGADPAQEESFDIGLTGAEAASIISKKQFLSRIGLLSKKRSWIEKSARRSSIGFHEKYNVSDKAVMDAFLVALTAGIHVKRHQSGRYAEIVRLSSPDGCRSICWGSVNAVELAYQRSKEGVSVNPHDKYAKLAARHMHESCYNKEYGGMGLQHGADEASWGLLAGVSECLGCADDANDRDIHHRSQQILRRRRVQGSRGGHEDSFDNMGDLADHPHGHLARGALGGGGGGMSRGLSRDSDLDPVDDRLSRVDNADSWLYNMGFAYTGSFRDYDILAVHPASKEDPTALGNCGTKDLRDSQDPYNSALSFSVVLKSPLSSLGYITLDLEAEAEETYCLLLQGFRLLLDEANIREANHILENEDRSLMTEAAEAFRSTSYTLWKLASGTQADEEASRRVSGDSSSVVSGSRSASVFTSRESTAHRSDPVNSLFDNDNSDLVSRLLRGATTVDDVELRRISTGRKNRKSATTDASGDLSRSSFASTGLEGESVSKQQYGYVIDTPKQLPPAQFLGWRSAGTQIWARLKMAGLDVKCVFSWDLSRVILKVKAPQWRLEEVAEYMHLKKRNRDGSLRRFKVRQRDTFLPDMSVTGGSGGMRASTIFGGEYGPGGSIFKSSERQQIIDFIIRSKIKDGGAELGEDTALGSQITQRFPLHMQSRLGEIRHSWVTFWRQEKPGAVGKGWSPISQPLTVTAGRLLHSFNYAIGNLLVQPLDSIAEYFGESVAFYYAFAAFYTRWLVHISVLGLIVFCFQVRDLQLDHWLCLPYSICVMIWTCLFLVYWRQRSSTLAYRWGVLDYEMQETERPQFKGKRVLDTHTGEVRKIYPVWRRALKYCQSVPVLIMVMGAMLSVMSTVFTTQDKLLIQYKNNQTLDYYPEITLFDNENRRRLVSLLDVNEGYQEYHRDLSSTSGTSKVFSANIDEEKASDPDFWAVTFFFPCLYGVLTNIMVALFNLIAIRVNNFENHRTQSQYMNRLVLKVITFRFVAIFTTLYYYAFYSGYDASTAYMRMAVTIFGMMTAGQWTGAFIDICVPAIVHRLMIYRLTINISRENKNLYKAKEFSDDKKHTLWGLRYQQMRRMTALRSSSGTTYTGEFSNAAGTDTASGNEQRREQHEALVDLMGSGVASLSSIELRESEEAIQPTSSDETHGKDVQEQDEKNSTFPSEDLSSKEEERLRLSVSGSYPPPSPLEVRDMDKGTSSHSMDLAMKVKNDVYIQAIDSTIARRAKYLSDARGKCWEESMMAHYRSFADYSSLAVQFGFVIFFSPVFPLAPMIALINNLFLMRLGAFKMTYTRQRPIAAKSGGIGVWEDVLQIMSVVGILTNCLLMYRTSDQLAIIFPSLSDMGLAVGLFALEHCMLFFKYWLHTAIPRIPESVMNAMVKEQNRERGTREKDKKQRKEDKKDRLSYGGGEDDDGGGDGDRKRKGGKKKRKKRKSERSVSEVVAEAGTEDDTDSATAAAFAGTGTTDPSTDFEGPSSDPPSSVPVDDEGEVSVSNAADSAAESETGLAAQGALVELSSCGGPPTMVNPLEGRLSLRDTPPDNNMEIDHEDTGAVTANLDENEKECKDQGEARQSVCGTLEDEDSAEAALLAVESENFRETSGSARESEDAQDDAMPTGTEIQDPKPASSTVTDATSAPIDQEGHVLINGKCAMCGRSPVKVAPADGDEPKPRKSVRFALDAAKSPALRSRRVSGTHLRRTRPQFHSRNNEDQDEDEHDEWEDSDDSDEDDDDDDDDSLVSESRDNGDEDDAWEDSEEEGVPSWASGKAPQQLKSSRGVSARDQRGLAQHRQVEEGREEGNRRRRNSWLDSWNDGGAQGAAPLAAGGGRPGVPEPDRFPATHSPPVSPSRRPIPGRSNTRKSISTLPVDEGAWESTFFSKINEITAAVSALRSKSGELEKVNVEAAAKKAIREKERQNSATIANASSKAGTADMPCGTDAGALEQDSKSTPPPSIRDSEKAHPFMALLTPPGGTSTSVDKAAASDASASGHNRGRAPGQLQASGGVLGLEEKLRAAEAMLHGSSAGGDSTSTTPISTGGARKAKAPTKPLNPPISQGGTKKQTSALSPRRGGRVARGPSSTPSSTVTTTATVFGSKGRENMDVNTKAGVSERSGSAHRRPKVTFDGPASASTTPIKAAPSVSRSPRRTKTIVTARAGAARASSSPLRAKKSQTGAGPPPAAADSAPGSAPAPTAASGIKTNSAKSGDKKFAITNPFHFATRET